MNTFPIIPHSFNTNTQKGRKREPNAFILFRSYLRKKDNTKKMKMKEFSKLASIKWRKLTIEEKKEWDKKYHLNRDRKDSIPSSRGTDLQVINTNHSLVTINLTQIISASAGINDFNFICVCGCNIGNNPECSNCSMIYSSQNSI